jgi:hypothetical protein
MATASYTLDLKYGSNVSVLRAIRRKCGIAERMSGEQEPWHSTRHMQNDHILRTTRLGLKHLSDQYGEAAAWHWREDRKNKNTKYKGKSLLP